MTYEWGLAHIRYNTNNKDDCGNGYLQNNFPFASNARDQHTYLQVFPRY